MQVKKPEVAQSPPSSVALSLNDKVVISISSGSESCDSAHRDRVSVDMDSSEISFEEDLFVKKPQNRAAPDWQSLDLDLNKVPD